MSMQTKVIGRQPTDHGPYDPQLAYGKKFQCTLFGCAWESLHDNNNTAPAVWDGGDVITPNLVDWKKVSGSYEAWLMNKDKPATTGTTGDYPYNGMGRVVLKKHIVDGVNTLTHEAFEDSEGNDRENTIYVIQYDFTLGEDITVPANCVLQFEGGTIKAGGSNAKTLTANNTGIVANPSAVIFDGLEFAGSWLIKDIYATWYKNVEQDNNLMWMTFYIANENIYNNIYVPKGLTCIVDQAWTAGHGWGPIRFKSNSTLYLDGDIKLKPNDKIEYYVVSLGGVHNVSIIGSGKIIGDKDQHDYSSGGTHETGIGIDIWKSYNITIKGITICEMTGDGISNNGSGGEDNNILIDGVTIYNCRRTGMNIGTSRNVTIQDFTIYNISGLDFATGIDVEEGTTNPIENLTIKNGYIYNCNVGLAVFSQSRITKDVVFENIRIKSTNKSLFNAYNAKNILFKNCSFYGTNNGKITVTIDPYNTGADESSRHTSSLKFEDCIIRCPEINMYNTIFTRCLINSEVILQRKCKIIDSILKDSVISLMGNENTIESNRIYRTVVESDRACMYIHNTAENNMICNNKVTAHHDMIQHNGLKSIIIGNIFYTDSETYNAFVTVLNSPLIVKDNIYSNAFSRGNSIPSDVDITNYQRALTGIDTDFPLYLQDLLDEVTHIGDFENTL